MSSNKRRLDQTDPVQPSKRRRSNVKSAWHFLPPDVWHDSGVVTYYMSGPVHVGPERRVTIGLRRRWRSGVADWLRAMHDRRVPVMREAGKLVKTCGPNTCLGVRTLRNVLYSLSGRIS